YVVLFLQLHAAHRDLHSFPTRRSSDLAGAPPSEPPRYTLGGLPQPEYWTGIVFNGAKIGFSHTRVSAAGDGLYEIEGEAETRVRSEEHTSELQSLTNLVCRLLLEKKKK